VNANMRRWVQRLAMVLVCQTCVLAFMAVTASAKSRPPLALIIEGADSSLAAETRSILQTAHEQMVAASGIWYRDTLRVVYVGKDQSFDSVAGGYFPDWGVGVAIADRHLIGLRSPRDYPMGDQLGLTLRHELAHLHLELILGQRRPPRWMHEGYAQQFALEWTYGNDWTVARAVFTDNILPLDDIDGVNSFQSAKAQLAYAESYLAMGHFLERYGWDGLMLLAETMREGGDWDEAFTRATGADYRAYRLEFDTYLHERYNWAAFLGDTVLLWIGLVFLFVILYFLKRRWSRKRMQEWEDQEAITEILYGPIGPPGNRPPSDNG